MEGTETVQVTPMRRTLSVFSLIRMRQLPSVLWYSWLRGRKCIWPVKIQGDGGGGHCLVRMEWRTAGWSVCLPLLIYPCTIKSRGSLLAPADPGGPGKMAVKQLWWCGSLASWTNLHSTGCTETSHFTHWRPVVCLYHVCHCLPSAALLSLYN